MRTTVTIDPDLAAKLDVLARRRKWTFKETLNTVLRRGLTAQDVAAPPPFHVVPHDSALRPGVDPSRLNQLVDELDAAVHARRAP